MKRRHRHDGCGVTALLIVLVSGPAISAAQGIEARPVRPTPLEVTPPADRPSTVPGRATVLLPKAGANRGTASAPGLTVTFYQGGQPTFRAPAARHFVICLANAGPPTPACSWPGQFNAAVGSLPNTAYVHPQLGTQPMIRVYRFALPLSQASAYLDRDLSVVVGACTATATASCSFSEPVRFVWSTRNLTAPDFINPRRSSDGTTGEIRYDIVASSDGESDIGPFQVKVDFGAAVTDERTQRCITDVNAPQVSADDRAVTASGEIHRIRDLGSPRRQPAGVVGIISSTAFIGPIPQTLSVQYMPSTATARTVGTAVGFTFPWPAGVSWLRFIGLIQLDSGAGIAEANESDNVKVECLRAISK